MNGIVVTLNPSYMRDEAPSASSKFSWGLHRQGQLNKANHVGRVAAYPVNWTSLFSFQGRLEARVFLHNNYRPQFSLISPDRYLRTAQYGHKPYIISSGPYPKNGMF